MPWPKPFHGLRASCETELVERFPVQTVASWLGNSPKVALKHYLRVLPEHFVKAVRGDSEAGRNPGQSGQVLSGHGGTHRRRDGKTPEKTRIYRRVPIQSEELADGEGLEDEAHFQPLDS